MTNQWQSVPGQYNLITGGYNTPANVPFSSPKQPGYGTPAQYPTPPGQVLGASTTGGGVSTGGTPPSNNPPASDTDYLASLYSEIDKIYGETMGLLGNQESSLTANQGTVNADIEAQYGASKQSLGTEKTIGERSLTEAGTQAGQTKENALTAGTRLYNELQQGGVQRFGGASSAGQAYSEISGREYQRGQAGTQQAYQNAMTKITTLKSNLQDKYDSSIYNLEVQKNSAITEARRGFQEQLANIESMKVEAGQNKSTQRLELLQNLRNQVYQINLASVQTSTALAQQQQQATAQLAQYEQLVNSTNTSAGQQNDLLSSATTTNPQWAPQVTGNTSGAAPTYTGSIAKRREDMYA